MEDEMDVRTALEAVVVVVVVGGGVAEFEHPSVRRWHLYQAKKSISLERHLSLPYQFLCLTS